nr:hypothetical protein [Kibdelosporangium sp. MJ126-NF4]CTQ91882.1 hypothetical protein [Kibdelosporangium sp. MJ126-NF4]
MRVRTGHKRGQRDGFCFGRAGRRVHSLALELRGHAREATFARSAATRRCTHRVDLPAC